MPLSFPHQEDDIRLVRSPLVEVVCQVRFPPILRISGERPADFQDRIRKRFPDFETEHSVVFKIEVSSGVSLPDAQSPVPEMVYKFISRKRASTVTLAEDFFALSTNRYVVWEEFAKDLKLVIDAIVEVYDPSHATRIGLRYVNFLEPQKLGLATLAEVVHLIQPELTCAFKTTAWNEPSDMATQLVLKDDEGRLGFRYGKHAVEGRECFALDFDYFQEGEELPLEGLVDRCERYHTVIYDAFRWSIDGSRLDAFEPMPKKEVLA